MRKISQIRPVGAEYGRAGGGLELGRRYFDKRGDRPVYVRTAHLAKRLHGMSVIIRKYEFFITSLVVFTTRRFIR